MNLSPSQVQNLAEDIDRYEAKIRKLEEQLRAVLIQTRAYLDDSEHKAECLRKVLDKTEEMGV